MPLQSVSGVEVNQYPYYQARDLKGEVVAVLQTCSEHRGMEIMSLQSRAIRTGDIHELSCTDEENAVPGGSVDRVSYLGFFEVTEGTLLITGTRLYLDGEYVGTVAGFNDMHMPNHYNILIRTADFRNGKERGFAIGKKLTFRFEEP